MVVSPFFVIALRVFKVNEKGNLKNLQRPASFPFSRLLSDARDYQDQMVDMKQPPPEEPDEPLTTGSLLGT
jgi:hypothetical protein